MNDYDRLEREPAPRRVRDWTAKWDTLEPVGAVNGTVRDRLDRFCERKRITLEALQALDTRILVRKDGTVCIAWAGRNSVGVVTALKHRPIDGSSHETKAESPSVWLNPIVVGNHGSLDWLVVEGESDTARLFDLVGDSCAILCLPTGAKTFKAEWAREIPRGAVALLCHDGDQDGDSGADKAARILGGKTVRVRPPPDVKDWCDWTGGRDEFVALVNAAKSVTVNVDGLAWERLSAIAMRSIVFVDKPLLQADAFHLVVGRKGMGKGTLLAEIASRVTRGELGAKRNVVWIGSEDSAAIDIKPRIVAAGGDPERILVVKSGWIQLPRDLAEIGRAIDEMSDVGMLAVDPLGNHIAGKNSDSEEVRDAIAPLNRVADEHACMVFGVRHLSEKECTRGVLAAILGSSAWVQTPRAVLAVARDDVDPEISHVQCVAGNRLPAGTPGRMFRIEGVLLDGLENEVTRAVWLGDSSKDVETMLSNVGTKEPSRTAKARELILEILEADGEQESDGLDARVARETGLAAQTIRNTRVALGREGLVKAHPDKDEFGEIVCWKVSRTGAPRA